MQVNIRKLFLTFGILSVCIHSHNNNIVFLRAGCSVLGRASNTEIYRPLENHNKVRGILLYTLERYFSGCKDIILITIQILPVILFVDVK